MTLCIFGGIALRPEALDVGKRLAVPVFASHPIGQTLDTSAREKLIQGAYDLALRGSAVAVALVAVSALLFFAATTGPKRNIAVAFVGLTVFDLGLQALPYTSFEQMGGYRSLHAPLSRFLEQTGRNGRVLVLPRPGERDLVAPSEQVFMHLGLLAAGGYDPLEQATYRATIDSIVGDLKRGSPYLATVFGVRFIISAVPISLLDYRPVASLGTATLYENEEALPRFYLAPESRAISRPGDAITALKARDLGVGSVVFVEGPATVPIAPEGSRQGQIEVTVDDRERLVLAVQTRQAGMLVANDAFYPGWVAEVDGLSTPIFRANGLVRAVPVPAGTHTVELRFAPRTLMLGAWISICTAVLLVGAAAMAVAREKREGHANRDARPSASTR
jgi:hypothetical protein